jgi:uncharacterized protein YbjT (DUF2867 family)
MTPSSLASKRILLTGGTGFHGRAVVDALRRRGCSDLLSLGEGLERTVHSHLDRRRVEIPRQ